MGDTSKSSVLIADDHPLFRQGLRLLLEGEEDLEVVGEAGNGRDAIDLVRDLVPDIVVMDVSMPGLGGIEATRRVLSFAPETRVVALSMHSGERFVIDMLRAGAVGYVLKESAPEELVRGIRAVTRGQVFLSAAVTGTVVSQYLQGSALRPRSRILAALTDEEREVLGLVAEGNSGREIATLLQVSPATVQAAQERLVSKLGAGSVTALPEVALDYRGLADELPRSELPEHAPAILRTKLHRPALPTDLVPRTGLIESLGGYERIPLTLVSAPAGYGKSVLVTSWLDECSCPNAWLSLDETENQLSSFLTYVVAAMRSMFPGACEELRALLNAGGVPPESVLAETMINDLDGAGEPYILVLDDLHLVHARSVHELLSRLVEYPPRGMHLVLSTRRDPPLPLGTLRAQGRMHELSAGQLRFDREETAEFLRQARAVSIGEEALTALDRVMEGWPAGLRLLVNALRGGGDLDRILRGMQSRDSSTFEYLAREVLGRLPPKIEDLVLRISILDRISGPLVEALGGSDSGSDGEEPAGHEFLAMLREHNLFLVSLDPENVWFRYHHLFQQVLRGQLEQRADPEQLRSLHARAGAWFAENGLVEEAIRHLLSAGDPDGAARLIEQDRQALLNNDRWFVLDKWLSLMPEETFRKRPYLLIARSWVHYHHFDLQAIPATIAAAEARLTGDESEDPLRGEIEFFRGYLLYFQNQGAGALECFQRARERIPESNYEIRAQNELLFALTLQLLGRDEEAVAGVADLLTRRAGAQSVARTRLQVALVYIRILAGDLPRAGAANRDLLDFAFRRGFSYARAWAVYLRGLIRLYRNDLEEAISDFREAEEQKYVLHTRAVVDSMAGLVLAYQATGRTDLATAAVERLRAYAASLDEPGYSLIAESTGARLSLVRGEPNRAFCGSGEHRIHFDENAIWWLEVPAITYCRVLIADGSDTALEEAGERLGKLLSLCESNHNVCHLIEVLVLMACVHERRGREREALDTLDRAAGLAQRGGVLWPFLEPGPIVADLLECLRERKEAPLHVRRILAAFRKAGVEVIPDPARAAEEAAAGILTSRECEVLSLAGEGLINKEIAAHLHVSIETVKKHLTNTYRKLEADGRVTALARARQLGILRTGF